MGTCPSMKFTKKVWETKAAAVKAEPKKATRYYPAEDVKKKLNNHNNTTKQTKLRKTITEGSVLILLAGRYKGQRVVFLKQLESGLLLITGPYKVNGVPLRRVPQSYVIGTATKVDVSGVKLPENVNDAFFKKPKTQKKKDDEDAAIVAAVGKTPLLKEYLSSKFSLKKGDKP